MHSLSVAEKLASLSGAERAKALELLTDAEADALLYDWRGFFARPSQIAPDGDWSFWMVLAGRGFGKTRSGAEWIREKVLQGHKRIAIVAETQRDLEKVMVEGTSGLLSVFPEDERPRYTKKPVELVFNNGCVIQGFNATQPDQLRGPQFSAAWCDELAKWSYARETWDMLQFCMRLGDNPQTLITTTPRPIELLKSLVSGGEGECVITRGKLSDNVSNLSEKFIKNIQDKYGGTRLGRQEIDGEILGDTPNALWRISQIDLQRVSSPPQLQRIVVAVDPAISNTDRSDEHGIIVCGLSGNVAAVLADGSLHGSPLDWARRAIALYDQWGADAIIIEINQGGDMVAQTLRSARSDIPIIEVRAKRGKHLRAEPVAALYEQGRVIHAGNFASLEDQMIQMTSSGFEGSGSPDRVDALVYALTNLFPLIIRDNKKPSVVHIPRSHNPMASINAKR